MLCISCLGLDAKAFENAGFNYFVTFFKLCSVVAVFGGEISNNFIV